MDPQQLFLLLVGLDTGAEDVSLRSLIEHCIHISAESCMTEDKIHREVKLKEPLPYGMYFRETMAIVPLFQVFSVLQRNVTYCETITKNWASL